EVLAEDYDYKNNFYGSYRIIAGKRTAPPEDCGGVYGYYDLVEAIKDPNHPNHEHWIEFAGEDWDPDCSY
ncbi:MAG: plasmid pRiA4b ORF-3 family protein, partial [Deltaproteobacteria bacterium]|nr:plasmid pRiA4b ORF-3 family protein [Deltaproteobacteria bacterium]